MEDYTMFDKDWECINGIKRLTFHCEIHRAIERFHTSTSIKIILFFGLLKSVKSSLKGIFKVPFIHSLIKQLLQLMFLLYFWYHHFSFYVFIFVFLVLILLSLCTQFQHMSYGFCEHVFFLSIAIWFSYSIWMWQQIALQVNMETR